MASLYAFVAAFGIVQTFALSSLLAIVLALFFDRFTRIKYSPDFPRIREKKGSTGFSWSTRLAYYTNAKELYRDTYEKYSKLGKTCLIPGVGSRTEVIIPISSIRWMTSQPDSVLSMAEHMVEFDRIEWSAGHRKFLTDLWHVPVVKRGVEKLMVSLDDEYNFAFPKVFGTDTKEWKPLKLYRTMQQMIGQGSSRFTVGLPLCRNQAYLRNSQVFADLFIINAGIFGLLPKLLHPIIGPFVIIPIRYRLWRLRQILKPYLAQRMEFLKLAPEEDEAEPQDHLQWMLRYAQENRPISELNLWDLTTRLAMSNLGSVHQTGIATTNILFNIIDSDAEYNTISLIRSEAENIRAEYGEPWTKAKISNMIRIDSIIRETLRISSFTNRSITRKVMVDNLRTEDGLLLPKGSDVSVLSYPAQSDSDVFEDPFKFDPFRFSRLREKSSNIETGAEENGKPKPSTGSQTFIATGPTNLPFSHGKHACPGRFLLDFELKMMISYIILNYDLAFPEEYKGKRPDVVWMAEVAVPPEHGEILVRRREGC